MATSVRSSSEALEYCRSILPHVSRTFALTIPVLREPLRTRVGVSYLLCRIADTIEDRSDLDAAVRADIFATLKLLARDSGNREARERLLASWSGDPNPHYQGLLEQTGTVLDCVAAFPEPVREAVADCVEEMVDGMSGYPGPQSRRPVIEACTDLADLETYCHFVAGTVGCLLTRLFATELEADWATPERMEEGRRFGLGLQLTNILKDHPNDQERGIRYIPSRWVAEDRPGSPLTREGAACLIGRAVDHLSAGHRYILSIPPDRDDMRLFCLWAAHLALATLRLVALERGGSPVKVNREDVWAILERARKSVTLDHELQGLERGYRDAVLAALEE